MQLFYCPTPHSNFYYLSVFLIFLFFLTSTTHIEVGLCHLREVLGAQHELELTPMHLGRADKHRASQFLSVWINNSVFLLE